MKKILIALCGLSVAGALAAFPGQVSAHGGDPHDEAKAIAAALKNPLVIRGTATVRIAHVKRGCHVWTNGKRKAAGLKVHLRRGQTLTVTNQDLDNHRLIRLAGPKIELGTTMRMNQTVKVRFTKAGTYRLRTKKTMNPGMPEVKTIGKDNLLPIVVVVR